MKSVIPWGVNVPFVYLAFALWGAGAVELLRYPSVHPYLMMLGAYSLYFGMIQRLFFPARKYFVTQLMSMAVGIPLHWGQVTGSAALLATEVWSLVDVKRYGSKYPVNYLVLSSVPMTLLAWTIYGGNYWLLVPPLLSYLLGVNEGVFSSTLRIRPRMGIQQLPIMASVMASWFFPVAVVPAVLIYVASFGWKGARPRLSALITLVVMVVVPTSSVWLGYQVHAFTLGIMSPLFSSCVTFSLSSENYDLEWPAPLLFAASYFTRQLSLLLSGLPWITGMIFLLFLISRKLGLKSLLLDF